MTTPTSHEHQDLHGRSTGRLHGRLHGRFREAHAGMYGLAGHASWYQRGPGRLARPLYRRIAADVAAAGLPDGAVVLDVGTGPGMVALLVAQQCPGVVVEGVDLAEPMIDTARRTAAGTDLPDERLRYRVADVAALPYPDASVDLVVSSLSLHHWTDVPAGLAEIRRVLRPGGRAWIYDVRRVLRRVSAGVAPRGIDVRLEPLRLGRWPSARPAEILAALLGHLLGRLTLSRPAAPR
jgi:SAM-dependent methyltransferase